MEVFFTEREFNLIHDFVDFCDEKSVPREMQYRMVCRLQHSLYLEQDVARYKRMIIAGGMPFLKEKPCKIVLETDGMGYGSMPEDNDPVIQRISLTESGRATITCYNWNRVKLGSESFRVDTALASALICEMANHFACDLGTLRATDVGSWKLTFTCDNKEKIVFDGDLLRNSTTGLFSDKLRNLLGRQNLLCFDGRDGVVKKYRICTCVFHLGENEYYYRSDDPEIQIGDTVVVPVGNFGRTVFATVINIELMEETEIDYPLDKIKFIESSLALPVIQGEKTSVFDVVKKAIDMTDCEGLLDMGAPKDEYDGESKMIAQKIAPYMDKYQIATVISEIMTSQFNEPYSGARFYDAAEYILNGIKAVGLVDDRG